MALCCWTLSSAEQPVVALINPCNQYSNLAVLIRLTDSIIIWPPQEHSYTDVCCKMRARVVSWDAVDIFITTASKH